MSRNMLEMPHLVTGLSGEEKDEIVRLRMEGRQHLCSLRKENLTSWNDSETESARHVFTLEGSEESGSWHPVTELPFRADKWCFTTVVLYNYLYIIGGYRQRVRRGWEFKMASFRFNPFTGTWACTAPLMKHRRHFSAVACEGCIYAVGGWYLDSLITPDSNTTLYTAVERYDPWEGRWRFVSSLPLTDFQFTMSLSHDIPLTTSHGHCLYVLGSIQRTGEKLLLQYNTKHDSWSELLPTLTRADADLPALYFLGATDRLIVIGGNNSESVVTSFCVQSRRWEQVRTAEKVAFAGQGTLAGDQGPPDAKYTAQHHHSDGPPNSVHQRSSPSTHCYPLRSYPLSVFLNVLFLSWLAPHFIIFFRVLWLKRSSARTLRLDLKCVLERFF
ncbi:hypothetical protein fugu_012088 [Takifugu bimaculatus]|uniref:Uncharacterized protein n=1 Tax=Takifugu bimaculatus TaxID=433685 RepID=A0A4Z2C9F1_9TELE|nr:hypothetical protein fugu_012088 [Takifugu bimaculatus]